MLLLLEEEEEEEEEEAEEVMVEEEEEELASSTSSSYSSSESTSSSSSSYPWRLLLPPPDGSFVVRRGARKADPWLRGGAMERIGSACCCIRNSEASCIYFESDPPLQDYLLDSFIGMRSQEKPRIPVFGSFRN